MNHLISLLALTFTYLNPLTHAQEVHPVVYHQGPHTRVMFVQERPGLLPIKLKDILLSSDQEMAHYENQQRLFEPQSQTEMEVREAPDSALWDVTHSWNDDWEKKFSAWIQNEVTPDFFGADFATDCADAIYALRWIFARNNGLPAANRIGRGQTLFTHRSVKMEWLTLPTHIDWRRDQRFLAALNYLVELSYSQLLIQDTYPIAISAAALLPGRHYTVAEPTSYHNYLIHKVSSGRKGENPISLLSSTVPRAFRSLAEDVFLYFDQPQSGGFRGHLWPRLNGQGQWHLQPAQRMPHYSEEQFQPDFVADGDFSESVFDRIAPERSRTSKDRLMDRLGSIYRRFLERVYIVEHGFLQCYPNRCAEGTQAFDAWSTPTRDRRIRDQILWVGDFVSKNPDLHWSLKLYLWNNSIQIEADNFGVLNLSMNDLFNTWRSNKYSSNPNASRSERWGF